jgi:NTE family protein
MDEDALRLERANAFVKGLPPGERHGYRPVDLAIIRPSQDLGRIAAEYEPQLPRAFRFLTRSLGTKETSNADFLSLLMFVPEYLQRLIELGETDALARMDAIDHVAGGASSGGPAGLEAPRAGKVAGTLAPEEVKQ